MLGKGHGRSYEGFTPGFLSCLCHHVRSRVTKGWKSGDGMGFLYSSPRGIPSTVLGMSPTMSLLMVVVMMVVGMSLLVQSSRSPHPGRPISRWGWSIVCGMPLAVLTEGYGLKPFRMPSRRSHSLVLRNRGYHTTVHMQLFSTNLL